MGGLKEGGDCWGAGNHIRGERAREGASGGRAKRKELTHIDKDYKLLQTTGEFLSSYLRIFSTLDTSE